MGIMIKMKESAERDEAETPMDVAIMGELESLDKKFFDGNSPVTGDPTLKICVKTSLSDVSGEVPVTIWDQAGQTLFGLTATKLQDMWERAVEDSEQQQNVLKTLNQHMNTTVRCICTVKVWSYGFKEAKHVPQLNVNIIETVEQ